MDGGMGASKLTYQEIDAWANRMREDITPFDTDLLRKMSISYVNMTTLASKPDCPDPMKELDKKIGRDYD